MNPVESWADPADQRDRLIVALDLPTLAEAIALVDRLPTVTFWKVGLELFIAAGPEILRELKARQKKIFLDLKLHDIANTMRGAARSIGSYGVDLLTVHGAAGRAGLAAAQAGAIEGAEAVGLAAPNVIAVTLLTSLGPIALVEDLQVGQAAPAYVLHLAGLAQAAGLAGAVCSPLEAAELRSHLPHRTDGTPFLLVCPGVRPTWADRGDQARTMTPREAIAAGATHLVIGRPITAAPDPIAAWDRLLSELAETAEAPHSPAGEWRDECERVEEGGLTDLAKPTGQPTPTKRANSCGMIELS